MSARPGRKPSRRQVIAGGVAAALSPAAATSAVSQSVAMRVRADRPGHVLSSTIFGSNEIGAMDGGPLSADLDRAAGITLRRLGGNLMTTYNWTTNATNAGKDWRHSNGGHLLTALRIPEEERRRPAVVIETMHEATLAMGAASLVTLPLAGYVAGDFGGVVDPASVAPSPRFTPVRWDSKAGARDPVDVTVCDVPQLIRRLMQRYGAAGDSRGIRGYILDNEPGIWFQNHPRLFRTRITISEFLARSIAAARTIKSIDPQALVFGPSSWGATEMVSFQDAPDWPQYRHHGSFLAAYLDAFRRASEADGKRLLDVLDIHWYPFSAAGSLFRSEQPHLDRARLDAPRSLDEAGFIEDSWVPRAIRSRPGTDPLALPILPNLKAMIARRFPGTDLAVTEFNYGGAGRHISGLALAEALLAYARSGVAHATHWGSLPGWLGEAYRLFRIPAGEAAVFSGRVLPVEVSAGADLSACAVREEARTQIVVINRGLREQAIDLTVTDHSDLHITSALGFDGNSHATGLVGVQTRTMPGGLRIVLPALSARRFVLAG